MKWRIFIAGLALWLVGLVPVWAAGTGDKIWVRTYEGIEGEVVCVQEETVEEFLYTMYYRAPGVEEIISLNGKPLRDTEYAKYAGKIPVESKIVKESTWKPNEEPIIRVEDENRNSFVFEDQRPVIRDNRVLVPFRAIFEQLNCKVEWDESQLLVHGEREGTTIDLWINNKIAKVNGKSIEMDVPAQLINDRTMVPVRFVAESLGIEVEWRENSRIVRIHDKSVWD